MGRSLQERLDAYVRPRGIIVTGRLGFGKDGSVWNTADATAIKVYGRIDAYERERDVYARLAQHGVSEVSGHAIPRVLNTAEDLHVIEMLIVQPPFVLDFATAKLDEPMEFPEEIMGEWAARKREEFGKNWPKVVWILRELERMEIYMLDVHPGNIKFSDE
jgi:hypothetical protein